MKKVTELTENEGIVFTSIEEVKEIFKLCPKNSRGYPIEIRDLTKTAYYPARCNGTGAWASINSHILEKDITLLPARYFLNQELYAIPSVDKRIDNVTTDRLHKLLKLVDIRLPEEVLDKIIDCVELIEDKGGEVTIDDVEGLQKEWEK